MVNAYGPWVDTNVVSPLSADSCSVQFDWYVTRDRAVDTAFVDDSIAASHQVQLGDTPHASLSGHNRRAANCHGDSTACDDTGFCISRALEGR